MPKNSNDGFDNYMTKVDQAICAIYSRRNLVRIPDEEAVVNDKNLTKLCREGEELILLEEKVRGHNSPKSVPQLKKKSDIKKTPKLNTTNPYVCARKEILSKMTNPERTVIKKMESGALKKDSRYDRFCNEIRIRGDELSSHN